MLLYALAIVTLFSCNENNVLDKQVTAENVPTLIDRNVKIQLGKEWDLVQSKYVELRNKINKDSEDNRSRLELAQIFVKEARITGEHGHYYPAALEQLEKMLSSQELANELKFLALTNKAGVELALHEFSNALETGTKALALNSQNAQIYGVLVDANVELGNYVQAVKYSDKMVSIKPDIRSYSRVSYLREIHGDIDGAIQAMTLAVEAGYPGYEETAWAMQTLAETYIENKELDKAEKVFTAILAMRNNYPFAVAGLGDIAFERGQIELAEKKYREAIDIIPEVGFYINLATILKMTDRDEEFYKMSKDIDEMLLDDVENGHNMNLEYASLYLEQRDDPNTALKYAKKEYDKRPLNIDVNSMMAQIHANLGNRELVENFSNAAKSAVVRQSS